MFNIWRKIVKLIWCMNPKWKLIGIRVWSITKYHPISSQNTFRSCPNRDTSIFCAKRKIIILSSDVICCSIKVVSFILIPIPIRSQSCAIDCSIIPIPTFIIGVAVEWVPCHQAVGGEVSREILGCWACDNQGREDENKEVQFFHWKLFTFQI